MSQLADYLSLMDLMLGAGNMYHDDTKAEGLNAGSNELLLNYDVKEFRKEVNLTFVSGKATVPADYLRYSRLFDINSPRTKYRKVSDDEFDLNQSNTWCKKADFSDSDIQKFFIYPTSITSRRMRYVKIRTKMANQSDESGFTAIWDNPLAAYGAYYTLMWDRQYEAASALLSQAQEFSETALKQQANEEEGTNEIKSKFDDESILGPEYD
jgi:hypothetical protein